MLRLETTKGIVTPYQAGVCYSPGGDSIVLAKLMKAPPPNAVIYTTVVSNSIRKLSAVDASFQFDAFISVAWQDSRYNASAVDLVQNAFGDDSSSYAWATSQGGFEPALDFANALPVAPVPTSYFMQQGAPAWTGVNDTTSTWISSEGRISGAFLQPQSLRDFPFDSQYASVSLVSRTWPASSLTIVVAPTAAKTFVPASDIDGWNKQSGE